MFKNNKHAQDVLFPIPTYKNLKDKLGQNSPFGVLKNQDAIWITILYFLRGLAPTRIVLF